MHESKRKITGLVCLALGTAIWLPLLHIPFVPSRARVWDGGAKSIEARQLAARGVTAYTDTRHRGHELVNIRAANPEWDMMARLFLVLSLANMAKANPPRAKEHLQAMDAIIELTLVAERLHGFEHFLLPYAKTGKFRVLPRASQFNDGEIALMIAARRLVKEAPRLKPPMDNRIARMATRMKKSKLLCAESYPNECWLFCNTIALSAIQAADRLDGSDHGEFLRQWVATAKQRLINKKTGLLLSAFDLSGKPAQGPEGSSLWIGFHFLRRLDPDFARQQYRLARTKLGRSFLGFGYAREWPPEWVAGDDIDSGISLFGASPASSGLAFIAARSFGDADFFLSLTGSLRFAGLPYVENGRRRFLASNLVGDMVFLYGLTAGHLWKGDRK